MLHRRSGPAAPDWQLRTVRPILPLDHVHSARHLKIIGDPALAEYDEVLWVDNRIELLADPDELLDRWLDGADVAVPDHSFRSDVVSEFQAVLVAGYDDSQRLYEQLTHYSALDPGLLEVRPPWTGILATRRTPGVRRAMESWFRHVLRYSRRDQLSFVQAMSEAELEPRRIELPNVESELHRWRVPQGRDPGPSAFQVARGLQPPVAEVGQLRHRLDDLRGRSEQLLEAQETQVRQLEEEVRRLSAHAHGLEQHVQEQDARLHHVQDQLAGELRRTTRLLQRLERVRRRSREALEATP